MLSVLGLGFLIGMRHAMDADHVAAVASLATRTQSMPETVRLGMAWGMGHTVTLFAIGSFVLIVGTALPETTAMMLEFAVGVMLVLLGLDVIRRLIQERIHIHAHRHDGRKHIHAHGHETGVQHDAAAHTHRHPSAMPMRALLVGLVHGMAGSAALILLTLSTIESPTLGVIYMLLFGVGSIAGMALLSVVIALPLRLTSHRMARFHGALTATIGLFTVWLGGSIVWELGFTEGLLL